MHVWNASLKNHDAGWKLQWIWGQQPGWLPKKPYSARRRKTRQNSGPFGPQHRIDVLQKERPSQRPHGALHLPEHPCHWQILPADISGLLHIFQPSLLVSVFLGIPRLCLGKVWMNLSGHMDQMTTRPSPGQADAPVVEEPRDLQLPSPPPLWVFS